jgi:hypothetical protein
MLEDPDNIIEGYDPSNPVHNPAGYIAAMQEVEKDIKAERLSKLKDKPGDFAKLGCVYWLIIIALCFFIGYLLTL